LFGLNERVQVPWDFFIFFFKKTDFVLDWSLAVTFKHFLASADMSSYFVRLLACQLSISLARKQADKSGKPSHSPTFFFAGVEAMVIGYV
jgi:hypothetical protein